MQQTFGSTTTARSGGINFECHRERSEAISTK